MRPRLSDRHLINALCGDLPDSLRPFADLARELEVSEEAVLKAIRSYKKRRWLRRFGATVSHRQVGLRVNALVAWNVPDRSVPTAARSLARQPAISHCYERVRRRGWPYNLYAMLHASSKEKCLNLIRGLADILRANSHRVLWTRREFKNRPMRYFGDTKRGHV